MKTYLNIKTSEGVETVDEYTQGEDSPANWREFRAYVREMISNYQMAGMNVYSSSRCTKEWKECNQ